MKIVIMCFGALIIIAVINFLEWDEERNFPNDKRTQRLLKSRNKGGLK